MGPPQGPSARCAIMVDKFSALPFDLAHQILSPLPLADFARLSCLSKGVRAFHLSNPIVKFTGFPSESIRTDNRRLDLLNCLDRFFILCGNNQIQSFSLHWLCNYHVGEVEFVSRFGDEKSQIIGWLQNAVSCNVESLTIFFRALMLHDCTLPMDLCLPFPCCVFDYEPLRSLIVDMRCTVLKASSFATSHVSNLVCMTLTNVTFEDDKGFCKWVSICCRFLKELLIDHVNGLVNITIESLSLESFSWISGSSCRTLQLTCPNLKRLKWVGYSLPIYLFMGEFNCLEEVEISFNNPEVDYAMSLEGIKNVS
ncbi:hypothetical protein ACLB2K_065900 [Fragaria x ananassa]